MKTKGFGYKSKEGIFLLAAIATIATFMITYIISPPKTKKQPIINTENPVQNVPQDIRDSINKAKERFKQQHSFLNER